MRELLAEHKFDHNALPSNYIDTPPNSLKNVQKNLALIEKLLNNENPEGNNLVGFTRQSKHCV